MKILKIKFENINSLKGAHEIDFSVKPLSAAGLFAITGPTGSGKTTILDVITLALYNRIPRVHERISKAFIEKTHLLLTRNMPDGSAEVIYECSKGIFSSKWSISSTRNGTLRDYEMQISNDKDKLLDIRKADVPAKNADLIGLNFDQFVRAIILAQGEFSAFLKSSKDERGKLLEQITGSWIYRELGKAAFLKNKIFGKELEDLLSREAELAGKTLVEEQFLKIVYELNLYENSLKNLESQIEKLNAENRLKEQIMQLTNDILTLVDKEKNAQISLSTFIEMHGLGMDKHRKLIPIQEKLWQWRQLSINIGEGSEKIAQLQKELENCENELAVINTEVKVLTGSDKEIDVALTEFEKKVTALDKEKNELTTLIKAALNEIRKKKDELGYELDLASIDTSIGTIKKDIKKFQDEALNLSEKLGATVKADPEASITSFRDYEKHARSYAAESSLVVLKKKEISENKSSIDILETDLSKLPEKIAKSKEEQIKSELILENLLKERTIRDLTAKLDDQRKKLVDGEPCPLCGSLEHPYHKEEPCFADELDESIKIAGAENEKLKKILSSLESESKIKTETLALSKEKIFPLTEQFEALEAKCRSTLAIIPKDLQHPEPEEMIHNIEEKISETEKFVKNSAISSSLNALMVRLTEIKDFNQNNATLEAKRQELFKGKDIHKTIQDFLSRLTKTNTSKEKFTIEKKNIEIKLLKDTREHKEVDDFLKSHLAEYQNIEDALIDLMESSAFSKLEQEETMFKSSLQRAQTELDLKNKDQEELLKKDTEKTTKDIIEELTKIQTDLDLQKAKRDEIFATKRMQEDFRLELGSVKVKIGKQRLLAEKWVLLNQYIGDAEGKRFSTYAQQLTLNQLVNLSNHRLRLLSERYLLDSPNDEEDDSLIVIDTHMGDLRRSVKSLSGGESFLISLALALALSDLASRNVEICSLFIDEGFGSLDKLTLDQTIDTLEKLQYESKKTIGVISHIEAMQERISTQIILKQGGQGYSTLAVVQV